MYSDPQRELSGDRLVLVEHLRRQGITSGATLAALAAVPREAFLPTEQRALAYEDRALAIGHGQTCSQPWMVAVVVQALDLGQGASVLEVGAGSGYLAAVLRAAGASRVVAIELLPELAVQARRNLNQAGVAGVVILVGDGRGGAPERGPFDAVVVSAAATQIPPALLSQVGPGGKLVCPVASRGSERLWCLQRLNGDWSRIDLGECRFVPLLGNDDRIGGEGGSLGETSPLI
ncbi:MAG: protein-L-isoaspartate(D-aspartate) O-methyltransferase [Candidatus Dormiibacterota bacterium]